MSGEKGIGLGMANLYSPLSQLQDIQIAQVIHRGALDIQVCVPEYATDTEIKAFADVSVECGTSEGWHIRREGDPALCGDSERVPCVERDGFVHVMLDA